jgi:hypothetical protein
MASRRRPSWLLGNAQRFPQTAHGNYRRVYRNESIGLSYKVAVTLSYKVAVEPTTKWPWISDSFHRVFEQVLLHLKYYSFTQMSTMAPHLSRAML